MRLLLLNLYVHIVCRVCVFTLHMLINLRIFSARLTATARQAQTHAAHTIYSATFLYLFFGVAFLVFNGTLKHKHTRVRMHAFVRMQAAALKMKKKATGLSLLFFEQ